MASSETPGTRRQPYARGSASATTPSAARALVHSCLQVVMVSAILTIKCGPSLAALTCSTMAAYMAFTFSVTQVGPARAHTRHAHMHMHMQMRVLHLPDGTSRPQVSHGRGGCAWLRPWHTWKGGVPPRVCNHTPYIGAYMVARPCACRPPLSLAPPPPLPSPPLLLDTPLPVSRLSPALLLGAVA